eukprot:679227-Pleurochrysis_carterae.AAC.4
MACVWSVLVRASGGPCLRALLVGVEKRVARERHGGGDGEDGVDAAEERAEEQHLADAQLEGQPRLVEQQQG